MFEGFWINLNLIFLGLGLLVFYLLVEYFNKKSSLGKKVCGVIALVVIFYWTTNVPYVDSHYSLNESKPDTSIESNEIKHIQNHEDRIANLERELKETKDNIKKLREHYSLFWQFIMYGSIYFIFRKILGIEGQTNQSQTD